MNELNSLDKQNVKRILVYGMTSNRGGIETYLMNYYRILVRKGLIFDFVTEHREIAYKDEIVSLGGKIYYVPSRREGLLKHMSSVRTILKQHKEYNTIYFNVLSASEVFTVLSAYAIKGVRRIVHSHNNSVKTLGRHRLLRPLLNFLANKKLACADEAAEFMFGTKCKKRNKVIIVSNAIDVTKYSYSQTIREEVRKKINIEPDKFVIGHVGRMCYQKNSLFLIDIFYRLYQKNNNAVLLYVGEGEDRKQVEAKIKEYNLENSIILLGMRDDVNELMQVMDVFVLPSRFEGLPLVVLEAQAAGLPCICSDCFTKKSDVTGNVRFIPLDKQVDYWATEILNHQGEERKDTTELIVRAGYSVDFEAEKLGKILLD